jgi:hypothetical protein
MRQVTELVLGRSDRGLSNLPDWTNKIFGIVHNAKAFHRQFILNRAILLKWNTDLIMNGLQIKCMKMEHHVFLESVSS